MVVVFFVEVVDLLVVLVEVFLALSTTDKAQKQIRISRGNIPRFYLSLLPHQVLIPTAKERYISLNRRTVLLSVS